MLTVIMAKNLELLKKLSKKSLAKLQPISYVRLKLTYFVAGTVANKTRFLFTLGIILSRHRPSTEPWDCEYTRQATLVV